MMGISGRGLMVASCLAALVAGGHAGAQGVSPGPSPSADPSSKCLALSNVDPSASPGPVMSRDERLGTQERVLDAIDTISSAVGFAGMYFDDDCGGVPVFLTAGDPEAFERFGRTS